MRVLEWRNYEIHYPRMALKTKWILGRLKRLLPCFILIGISLIGYMYTGQPTPVNIPAIHLRSPKGNMKKTPTEPTPTPDPPTRQWVIVVGRNASCNTLALTFVDWKVLMVDGRTARHRHSRCVVLNRDDIERSTTQLHQSDKRQSRLLAAYLYAIQRGAKAILPIMVSGDASTVQPLKHAATVGPQTGLVATSGGIMFDGATHFGCNRSSHGKHSPSTMSYSLCRHKVAAIQTTAACSGVRTPDPAITSPICDAHAPPVALANARFTPFHFDGALFTSDAFWALPAALVTDPDESLMWSLGVQRLLWLSGNQVVVRRCRTSLSSSASSRLFSTAARLNKWQCRATTMKQCILDLIANNSRLLKEPVTFSYSQWLEVLDKIGYTFPQFSDSFNEGCENVILHAVDHSVSTLRRHLGAGLYAPVPNLDPIVKLYSNTCHHHNVTLPNYIHVNFAQPWTQFNDVLLLVIFNNPHYEAIPYVETLYRPFFPNILYCGPGQIDVNRYPGVSNFTFSFISYGETPDGHVAGAFSYKCMAMALQMDYAVHGYLAAADDLLLVVHTLSELVTKAVWYRPKKSIRIGEISKLRECKLGMCDFYPHWPWWKDYQNATIDALREIANRRGSSAIMRECYQRLLSENGAADRPNGAVSDIYYIPSKLSQEFLEIVDVFLRHKVFLEIGVPTTIRCLVAPTDVQPLKGVAIWDMETRVQPWLHFKTKSLVGKSYWHPLKWGFLARGSTEYSQLYCTKVLPYLHDRLARTID